jgi:hypothetical protein
MSMPAFIQILFTVFENVFGFWPFILIYPILNLRKGGVRSIVFVWGFWAVLRVLLFFNPQPMAHPLTLIPEPLSTMLFFGAGLIVIAIWIAATFRKRGRI